MIEAEAQFRLHVCCCSVHSVCEIGEKEMFYAKLESVLVQCPCCDELIIQGDLNAVTGTQRTGYEICVGPYSSRFKFDMK